MQNLSFFAILAVLLGCAFFFSQQTELGTDQQLETRTSGAVDEPLADIPTCEESLDDRGALACFTSAAQISDRRVKHTMDELLDSEPEAGERMALMDTQLAWEESRDADCSFVHEKSDSSQTADLRQAQCLLSHNLARLEMLESYLCDLYGTQNCDPTEVTSP